MKRIALSLMLMCVIAAPAFAFTSKVSVQESFSYTFPLEEFISYVLDELRAHYIDIPPTASAELMLADQAFIWIEVTDSQWHHGQTPHDYSYMKKSTFQWRGDEAEALLMGFFRSRQELSPTPFRDERKYIFSARADIEKLKLSWTMTTK